MNLKYICLTCIVGLISGTGLQASLLSDSVSVSPITYKESYKGQLGLYVYGISKFSNFQLKENGQKNDSTLKYHPNNNFNLGLGFSYKWLGLGIAFNLPFINNDNSLKGKTSSLDLQLDLYSRRLFMNGNLQVYQGYYWSNPETFYSDWDTEDSLVVRPDVTTVTLGFNGVYIFNHEKFSFKAAYQFTERQVKSAGSMLLGFRFSLYAIGADSALVPAELHPFYPNSTEIGSLSSISLGAAFGYTHTFIVGKYFFVNGLFMFGLNNQVIAANDIAGEQISSAAKISTNVTFRTSIGFNKPKSYYGMAFNVDSFLLRDANSTELSYSFGKFRIYYGRRFSVGGKNLQ